MTCTGVLRADMPNLYFTRGFNQRVFLWGRWPSALTCTWGTNHLTGRQLDSHLSAHKLGDLFEKQQFNQVQTVLEITVEAVRFGKNFKENMNPTCSVYAHVSVYMYCAYSVCIPHQKVIRLNTLSRSQQRQMTGCWQAQTADWSLHFYQLYTCRTIQTVIWYLLWQLLHLQTRRCIYVWLLARDKVRVKAIQPKQNTSIALAEASGQERSVAHAGSPTDW